MLELVLRLLGYFLVGLLLITCAWTLYNVPILAVGVRDFVGSRRKLSAKRVLGGAFLPSFSIIVPVKNEAKVVGRLLSSIERLNYPSSKVEVIIVEDGSTDGSFEVCEAYARSHGGVRVLRRAVSDGKPSALNFGLRHARGDIVAVFDADSVVDADALRNAAEYFADPAVAAVQGRTLSINAKENMLTEFVSYEEAVWCEAYLRGKDALDLFVHLRGSCQFIRRDVLDALDGFDEKTLSEDMEFSARLAERDYRIRYAPDVQSWQESPSSLRQLFTQRLRWFRGTMHVALRYGQLMARLNKKRIDAEATLFGPFVLIASLTGYLVAVYGLFAPVFVDAFLRSILQFTALATTVTLLMCGLALVYVSKPMRMSNLLWLPFIYFYWSLQAFIAL
ncbi:MAG: glycosyltransferase, partial [Candidatus Bathyarchaeia archaeon]